MNNNLDINQLHDFFIGLEDIDFRIDINQGYINQQGEIHDKIKSKESKIVYDIEISPSKVASNYEFGEATNGYYDSKILLEFTQGVKRVMNYVKGDYDVIFSVKNKLLVRIIGHKILKSDNPWAEISDAYIEMIESSLFKEILRKNSIRKNDDLFSNRLEVISTQFIYQGDSIMTKEDNGDYSNKEKFNPLIGLIKNTLGRYIKSPFNLEFKFVEWKREPKKTKSFLSKIKISRVDDIKYDITYYLTLIIERKKHK